MEELEYLWEVGCVRTPDNVIRYDLWLYPDLGEVGHGSSDLVTSFDHYPDEEEVFAATAMWRVEHGG